MKEALIVVDMLNDFVNAQGALPVPRARTIIPAIARRVEAARKAGNPIIYLVDTHHKDDGEFAVWGEHAVAGSWGNEIIEELAPAEDDHVVAKKRFSGFFGTELDMILRELDVGRVIITGVLTNICVFYTASDAYQRGYEVEVPRDAVAAVDDELEHFALLQLERVAGVTIS